MAQGTLFPSPIFIAWNSDGDPVSGALLTFYLAGTSTLANVYTDVNLTIAHTSPVVANAAGRFAEIFLTPGTSYKVTLTTPGLVALPGYPADNISAVPNVSGTVDIPGVFGEAIVAGNGVYLSNGSGALTAGKWYKWDADNTYSSTDPEVGMVLAAYAANATGTIRQGGQVTGLSGLTSGTTYYISATAGALTATQPSNGRRVGVADSTSSLIISANPSIADLGMNLIQLEAFL